MSAASPATTRRRSPQLIALQTVATIFLAFAIGQAGWAAAFLTGGKGFKHVHEIGGMAMAVVAVVMLVVAVVYVRSGGPRWSVVAAVLLVVGVLLQITLGELKVAAVHIFFGVLYIAGATVYISYLFRPGYTR
ncbi:heme A synthase [Friedmanniella endophytica]|uniref:Heme A synthase n=1 Tax=Microlunatus kandeliicorticis TaxID=1759536 RepID=A0A7W3P6H4_9ACTN|nr:hypothetical protein [Microlunatus kandeliicorticis]MBA8794983.1 heme A synthase [Microlunatus kandeliicorticis]